MTDGESNINTGIPRLQKYWKLDQNWLKLYIFMIWVFDTVHQALVLSTDYGYFVRAIADPILLTQFPEYVLIQRGRS